MRRRREQRSPAAVTLPSADGGAGYLPDRYVNKDSSPAAGRHGTQVLKRVARPGKRRGQPTTTAVPRGAGARASCHRVARVDLRWRRADTSACYSAIHIRQELEKLCNRATRLSITTCVWVHWVTR